MGYYIHYGNEMKKTEIPDKPARNFVFKLLCLLCAGCVAVYMLIYGVFGDFSIIPGDPEITTAAALQLFSDINNGCALQEACFDFCLEIIDHGTR